MKFNWSEAGFVGVISSIGVAIMVLFPEQLGLGIGFIIGAGISATGADKKLRKKIKEIIKKWHVRTNAL
jgi:hypothetical protein